MELKIALQDHDRLRFSRMNVGGDALVGIGEDLADPPATAGVVGRDQLTPPGIRPFDHLAVRGPADADAVQLAHCTHPRRMSAVDPALRGPAYRGIIAVMARRCPGFDVER